MASLSQFIMQVEDRNRKNKEELLAQLQPIQQNMIQAKVAEEKRQNSLAMKQEERAYKENQAKVANDQQVRNILLRDQLARDRKLEESKMPLTEKEKADLEIKKRNATTSEGNLAVSQENLALKKAEPKTKNTDQKKLKVAEVKSATAFNNYAKANQISGIITGKPKIKLNGKTYQKTNNQWVDNEGNKLTVGKKKQKALITYLDQRASKAQELFSTYDADRNAYITATNGKTESQSKTSNDPASKWEK